MVRAFPTLLVLTLTVMAACNSYAAGEKLAPPAALEEKYCTGCHAIDKKLVGPSFQAIAQKYRDRKDAAAYLSNSIAKGSTGVWGTVPMPAADVTKAEADALVSWILKQ